MQFFIFAYQCDAEDTLAVVKRTSTPDSVLSANAEDFITVVVLAGRTLEIAANHSIGEFMQDMPFKTRIWKLWLALNPCICITNLSVLYPVVPRVCVELLGILWAIVGGALFYINVEP